MAIDLSKYNTKRVANLASNAGFPDISSYLMSENKFGISKLLNPFSKVNLPSTAYGVAGTAIEAATPLWAKGRKATGVGGAALTGLNKLGDIGIASGNPYAMAAGLVAKGISSIGLAAIGNNAEHLANYDDAIKNLRSSKVDSSSTANIIASSSALPNAMRVRHRSFGWLNNGLRNLYRMDMANADKFKFGATLTAVNDFNNDIMKNFKITQAYNGGPLEMVLPDSAIGYDAMQTYLRNGYLNATKNNKITSVPNSFSNQLAFGGNVLTGGNTYNLGLTHINPKALTHEENPYGGVDMGYDSEGNLNQVEGEEIVLNGPTEDTKNYVMSNRLTVPIGPHSPKLSKKERAEGEPTYEEKILRPYEGMTFADATKKLERKIYGDKGDNMRRDSMLDLNFWHDMQILVDALELLRQLQLQQEMMQQLALMSPEELMMLLQQMLLPYQLEIAPNMFDYSNSMLPAMNSELYVPSFLDEYNISPILDAMTLMSAYGGKLCADGGKINKKDITDKMNSLTNYAKTIKDNELLQSINKTKKLNLRKQQEFLDLALDDLKTQYNQYANGGSMSLDNPNAGNIVDGNKVYAGEDWRTLLAQKALTDELVEALPINWLTDNWYNAYGDNPWLYPQLGIDGAYKYASGTPMQQALEAEKALTLFRNAMLALDENNPAEFVKYFLNQYRNTTNKDARVLSRMFDENGNLKPGWRQAYDEVSNDHKIAQGHNALKGVIPRYYYKDADGNKHWVNISLDDLARYQLGDIEVSPYQNSHLVNYNDREILGLLQQAELSGTQPTETIPDYRTRLGNSPIELPVVQQPVELPKPEEDPGKKGGSKLPPYPLPSNVPVLASIGLNGLMLANNLFSPLDTSESDYLLNASRNSGYMPISTDPKQVYVHPHVLDLERALINADNLLMGAARGLTNNAGLNRGVASAGLIGLYNNGIALQGAMQLQALNQNALNERLDAQVIYGLESDNAARALSVAQANQLAYAQAISRNLDLRARAMGLRQLARQNRERAISSNLSGILNSINNYYMQKYPAELLGWYLQTGGLPGVTLATPGFGSGRMLDGSSGKSIRKCGGKLRKSKKNFKI